MTIAKDIEIIKLVMSASVGWLDGTAALSRLVEALPREGWVLVPVEPTAQILYKINQNVVKHGYTAEVVARQYKAMISASLPEVEKES